MKLLEPLAQELGVSLVELLQGARTEKESLTIGEAGEVLTQAIDQSQRITTRRYLRLFRWLLTGICVYLAYCPVVLLGEPYLPPNFRPHRSYGLYIWDHRRCRRSHRYSRGESLLPANLVLASYPGDRLHSLPGAGRPSLAAGAEAPLISRQVKSLAIHSKKPGCTYRTCTQAFHLFLQTASNTAFIPLKVM